MDKVPSLRPLSVKVIAAFFILGSLLMFPNIQTPAWILVGYFSGLVGSYYNFLLTLVGLYLGIGLWRLRENARRMTIRLNCFYIVNSFLALVLPSGRAGVMEQALKEGWGPSAATIFLVATLGMIVIFLLLANWFLIIRKTAFSSP